MIRDPIKITKEKRFPHRVIIKVDQWEMEKIKSELQWVTRGLETPTLLSLYELLLIVK